MSSNHLILCCLILLSSSIFPSIRVFLNESVLPIRWSNYWSFSFSISPSNEYSWLISFRIHWLDLLAVQGTLKSLLQYHCSKASILQCSAVFTVQLSHPYIITGKTIALPRRTFVGQVMSLLLNMPSRLVITFLPRNKHLLISWLQSPSAGILEPPKNKSKSYSSYKGTNPIQEGSTLMTSSNSNYLSKTHFLIPSHLAVNLAGTTFSPQQMEWLVKGLQGWDILWVMID